MTPSGAAQVAPASTGQLSGIALRRVDYRPPGASRAVLEGLSLEVAPGEIFALLGESGSGKSTILRLINGLLKPSSGEILVDGKATSHWDPIQLRRRIGYVLQDDGLFPHVSVGANVALVPELLGWDQDRVAARVREMLELVNLPAGEFLGRYPAQLSGGQRQRVGLARALAADQPFLLLDEPFGRLDPITREKLREDFHALCRRLGKTAVFVTHDLREALLVGDRVGLLREGQLAFVGTPPAFLASDEANVVAYRETLALPGLNRSELKLQEGIP